MNVKEKNDTLKLKEVATLRCHVYNENINNCKWNKSLQFKKISISNMESIQWNGRLLQLI